MDRCYATASGTAIVPVKVPIDVNAVLFAMVVLLWLHKVQGGPIHWGRIRVRYHKLDRLTFYRYFETLPEAWPRTQDGAAWEGP